ncbi:MAG: hypothetical protein KAS35_02110 [Candidatus Marinimicrobia bacterium]|jgi:uncharacterized membrane protein YesL|nr:hypothetical protein [Candidatus Neomarinimicrobiota bacterium]
MNEINGQNQIVYELDSEGFYILDKLSKWNKIIGIFLVVMGIISLLGIFTDSSNPILVFFTIFISIFIVYLGTRLISAASHFKYSLYQEDSESLKIGMNNLRQYFMITGISYIVIIIFMIIAMVVGAFFGFNVDEFSEF